MYLFNLEINFLLINEILRNGSRLICVKLSFIKGANSMYYLFGVKYQPSA
jgi:hypothetical protein